MGSESIPGGSGEAAGCESGPRQELELRLPPPPGLGPASPAPPAAGVTTKRWDMVAPAPAAASGSGRGEACGDAGGDAGGAPGGGRGRAGRGWAGAAGGGRMDPEPSGTREWAGAVWALGAPGAGRGSRERGGGEGTRESRRAAGGGGAHLRRGPLPAVRHGNLDPGATMVPSEERSLGVSLQDLGDPTPGARAQRTRAWSGEGQARDIGDLALVWEG